MGIIAFYTHVEMAIVSSEDTNENEAVRKPTGAQNTFDGIEFAMKTLQRSWDMTKMKCSGIVNQ